MQDETRSRVIAQFSEQQLYDALCGAFPEAVRRIETWQSHLLDLPTDLATHVLGYAWKQAAALARTCRAINAIVKRQAFWTRAVKQGLEIPKDLPSFQTEFYKNQWTPFIVDLLPTLRDSVGWLFPNNGNAKLLWTRFSDNDYCLKMSGLLHDVLWGTAKENDNLMTAALKLKNNAEKTVVFFRKTNTLKLKTLGVSPSVCHIESITAAGQDNVLYHYEGQGVKAIDGGLWVPHGNGTWTDVQTGEIILQGDQVAFHGKIHNGSTWFAGVNVKRLRQ